MRPLRLGTRSSPLALAQSESVAGRLRALGRPVELVRVVARRDLGAAPNGGDGSQVGAFVTALEEALLAGEVDIAVHSAKDVPLSSPQRLILAAYPGPRADPRDALVSATGGARLATLPHGARVGTDSPRRTAFLLSWRPDLQVRPLNGNVDSRLRKLEAGAVDALVLAAAGLDRLGLGARIDQRLEPGVMAPAPGQGALAVQCREGEGGLLATLGGIDEAQLRLAVAAERWVLQATGGTCRSPVGALAGIERGRLTLLAAAATPDGRERRVLRREGRATLEAARELAAEAGRELMARREGKAPPGAPRNGDGAAPSAPWAGPPPRPPPPGGRG